MQAGSIQLQQKPISRLIVLVTNKKYEILLFSFMLLVFGNTFTSRLHVAGIINIFQNMATGIIVFYHQKRLRNSLLFLILISLALNFLVIYPGFVHTKIWLGIIYIIFFLLISKEVYKEVLFSKQVTREVLSAAFCGFIILCLITAFIFYHIELEYAGSFANVGKGKDIISNLNYFSFTTLLTIGYGDITPVSFMAKRAVMMMGLIGHFYTVFITSIIIGKYLSLKK